MSCSHVLIANAHFFLILLISICEVAKPRINYSPLLQKIIIENLLLPFLLNLSRNTIYIYIYNIYIYRVAEPKKISTPQPKRPVTLMCYICGREFGTKSLDFHLKACKKKWIDEEAKKSLKQRRPLPQSPKSLADVIYNIIYIYIYINIGKFKGREDRQEEDGGVQFRSI